MKSETGSLVARGLKKESTVMEGYKIVKKKKGDAGGYQLSNSIYAMHQSSSVSSLCLPGL